MNKIKEILKSKKVLSLLFILVAVTYFLVLCRGLLFKYVRPWEVFSDERYFYTGYNLVPFNGSGLDFRIDLIINTILFMPFGFMISMKSKHNIKSFLYLLIPLASSFIFEFTQYLFKLGAADVTDIIMNTVGSLIGFAVYYVWFKLKGNKADRIIVYLMSTVAVIELLLMY